MKGRVLEPVERIAEALFGLIMVLTFTGSLSVAEAGRDDVRTMLIGALGCNIAWGIIDGILYLMNCLSEQGHAIRALRRLHAAAAAEEGHRAIASVLAAADGRDAGSRRVRAHAPEAGAVAAAAGVSDARQAGMAGRPWRYFSGCSS